MVSFHVNTNLISKPAQTIVPISPVITQRWSPRVFDEGFEISSGDILALAEAGRWAPSSNNAQPWKFSFLKRGTEEFKLISEKGLTGFNQTWAPKAAAYVVIFAEQIRPDGNPWDKAIAFYNAGLASAQIVLQAEHMGLKSHYMGGIVHEEVIKILNTESLWPVNIIAVGKQAPHEGVPQDLQTRELAQRERKQLSEIVLHGLD